MNPLVRFSTFATLSFLTVFVLYALPAHAAPSQCDRLAAHPWDPNRVGEGVPWGKLDTGEAVEACKQAIYGDPNNPRYQFQYGRTLQKAGYHRQAVKWYRKAIEQRYVGAQFGLGVMYRKGEGVTQSDVEAAKWYRKAAEQGHATAQVNLGFMYERGKGVRRDNAESVKWYRKAAEQGHSAAQYNLGFMYGEGSGVGKDDAEAFKWMRKAADQGHVDAQYVVGLMYYKGQGVATDEAEALKWLRKAAEQGDSRAKQALQSIAAD